MSYYSLLDTPQVLQYSFYPIREWSNCPDYATDILVSVEEGIRVACRFYTADPGFPTVLFFHGNGEIASDYDDVAPYFFAHSEVNLVVAEFRGYGLSDGKPTFATVIADSHVILREISREMSSQGYCNDIWVMGRSMGSVPALELAQSYPDKIRGLIIESGFPSATRIARRLGFPVPESDIRLVEDECMKKIRKITMPALIIHGDSDSLVTINEAYTLEKELGSSEKRLHIVRGADHNSVMACDVAGYLKVIKEFIRK